MDDLPTPQTAPPLLITGPRGGGKTRRLLQHAHALLAAGLPARRLLVVAFSPRVAAALAARLPGEADRPAAGGVGVWTARQLCVSLWQECRLASGQPQGRVFSSIERALLLHAACIQSLGADDLLHPERIGAAGLAEIAALLDAIAAQGGSPDDLAGITADLAATAPELDRAALEDITRLYRRFRDLCERANGVTYPEVAARAAALLADPALAAPIAARYDHVLIDDLERAEPTQLAVFARLAMHAHLVATLDPAGLIGERGRRLAIAARDYLRLNVEQPGITAYESQADHVESAATLRILVAVQPLDSAEAAYVARQARAALSPTARPHATEGAPGGAGASGDEPEVLILASAPELRAPLLAALREAGVSEAADAAEVAEVYDPAVYYALAWLRVVIDGGDEQWERVLASPHALLPAVELARLRDWAAERSRRSAEPWSLAHTVLLGARGECEAIGDAARERLRTMVALLNELRDAARRGDRPGVLLHRLLAREELVGALLLGPTDNGAAPPDAHGVAGLCELVARLEALWKNAYGAPPTLGPFLERLEASLPALREHSEAPAMGRVVIANIADAADWRAPTVILPGLCAAFLPRPRPQSRLLSAAALDALGARWTLPWPADFDEYASSERRLFDLARAAARERLVLTYARRYAGDDTPAPSPLLLDWLDAPEINAATCHAAGVSYDDAPPRVRELAALEPSEAARDLPLLLHRHAATLRQRSAEAAEAFLAAAREMLAAVNAPAPARYLAMADPFAALPETQGCAPLRSRLSSFDLKSFLYCPRRFFYAAQAGLRAPDQHHASLGLLVGQVVKDLHRLYPALETVTPEQVEELLRLAWEGGLTPDAPAPGDAATEQETEALAGRFGPPLHAEATLERVRVMLRRVVAGKSVAPYNQRTAATGARVEWPVTLPSGRVTRVGAPVDRIAVRRDAEGRETLALIDYRSGAGAATGAALIKEFMNPKNAEGWHASDYTLPLMFLGAAQNREFYAAHELPHVPIRQLAVVALGKEKDGRPRYCSIGVVERRGMDEETVTLDEMRALGEDIAATVIAATQTPYRAAPLEGFNPCRDCAYRFACPGPEAGE